jgi:hypothetical protein
MNPCGINKADTGWISVEDSLPDDCVCVLVKVSYSSTPTIG